MNESDRVEERLKSFPEAAVPAGFRESVLIRAAAERRRAGESVFSVPLLAAASLLLGVVIGTGLVWSGKPGSAETYRFGESLTARALVFEAEKSNSLLSHYGRFVEEIR